MLRELSIKNLAIIKDLKLDLSSGLIVLTGETGAGKSIILDGLSLVIGEKCSYDMIRNGEDYLRAEGVFSLNPEMINKLKEFDIPENDELIIVREYDINGKSKILMNDRRVSLTTLSEIMENIVDLVGQHSHQTLLNKKYHIELVDKFLDFEGKKLKEDIALIVKKYLETENNIKELEKKKKEVLEKKEFYEYQYNELKHLNITEKEYSNLEEEYLKIFNAGKISDNIKKALFLLKDDEASIIKNMKITVGIIDSLSKYDDKFGFFSEKLRDMLYNIEEISSEIDNFSENFEFNEKKLTEVAKKLDKVNLLKKKYNKSLSELIEYKKDIENKLSFLEDEEFEERELFEKRDKLKLEYDNKCKILADKRRLISKEIEGRLVNELKDLNMKNVNFKVNFEKNSCVSELGDENLEFLISTNAGEELKPLSKIVSGGEVSRIMLALKTIFSEVDNIPTLVFDEIDTGIGGETLVKVAEKLKKISSKTQVFCITHSPHIASKADIHFFIKKVTENGKTETKVKKLDYNERVLELSRMIAGDKISETVINHAKELLRK